MLIFLHFDWEHIMVKRHLQQVVPKPTVVGSLALPFKSSRRHFENSFAAGCFLDFFVLFGLVESSGFRSGVTKACLESSF